MESKDITEIMNWIDQQRHHMQQLVTRWSNINSGTNNLDGLSRLSTELRTEFGVLDGEITEIPVPPYESIDRKGLKILTPLAPAISIRKRSNVSRRAFLGIHMDTVYGADHPFQHVKEVDANTLNGPGVADAKGGLCVMLIALQALERSSAAKNIGWEILINTDEEIGSPGSATLLKEYAERNHIGLVFEPAFADGALVGERKGSANYAVIIRGRSAHAGRDFHHGRNAIHAAAAMVVALERLNHSMPGVTLNVGSIDGGGPVNVVPDLAIVRFNVRLPAHADSAAVQAEIHRIVDDIGQLDGIHTEISGGISSPPKPMDSATQNLFDTIANCGRKLGITIVSRSSGGVSDGNKLAAAGLPVIDTMGPRGGNLHSSDEFLLLDSLTERAKLSALTLLQFASHQ